MLEDARHRHKSIAANKTHILRSTKMDSTKVTCRTSDDVTVLSLRVEMITKPEFHAFSICVGFSLACLLFSPQSSIIAAQRTEEQISKENAAQAGADSTIAIAPLLALELSCVEDGLLTVAATIAAETEKARATAATMRAEDKLASSGQEGLRSSCV
jgi:hypothetical protein